MRNDMQRLMSLVILGGVFVATGAAAQDFGANYGSYVSVAGGLSDSNNMDITLQDPISSAPSGRTVHFNTGWTVNGAVGSKWSNGVRTELEVAYRQSGLDRMNGTALTGSQKTLSLMGNVLYDFPTGSPVNFSVGGGIGLGRAKWHDVSGAGVPSFEDSDTNFQWQAIGEVSMPVGQRTALFADYRYITLANNSFLSTSGASRADGGTDRNHNVLVGLRYYFGS